MPWRHCARSNHCRSAPTAGCYTRADSCGGGTKDCKGMPGRVASQQGSESSQWRRRKGLRRSMPWRHCARSNHCRSAPTSGSCPGSDSGSGSPAPTAAARPASPSPATAGPAASVPENPVGANEFSTEVQAKARCPTDTVVWVNLTSKVYHFSGTRSYGNTKRGAYMCEHDTAAAGMRAAKNETHP